MRKACWVLALVAGSSFVTVVEAKAGVNDLLVRVPDAANTLVVVDVQALLQSPLAVREHWAEKHEADLREGAVSFPAKARLVLLASRLSSRSWNSLGELGIVELGQDGSIAAVAKAEGGYLDNVAGSPVAWSPRDAYFVRFAPSIMGVMYPADRQRLARWLHFAQTNKVPEVSQYLREAADIARQEAQVVIAIDLADMADPKEVRHALGESAELADAKVDLDRLATVLASVRGLTLAVRVEEGILGKVQVDFGQETSMMAPFAKDLMLDVLGNNGAMIEDFHSWQARVSGNAVSLQGDLSQEGLRRLLSLVELPSATLDAKESDSAKATEPQSLGDPQAKAAASKRYFTAVSTLVDDLRKEKKEAGSQGEKALWMERYSRKIDRLPILNVDSDLLGYGAFVAEELRNMAYALRGIGLATGSRNASASGSDNSYNYSSYRYGYRYQVGMSTKNRIRRQETAKGVSQELEIWNQIDNATADIRRKMVDRYKIEF